MISSIFRQSPTFMLKIRKRLDAHEPHELPCYGLTQKLHGRVTNPAYLCTRSTYAQTAAKGVRYLHYDQARRHPWSMDALEIMEEMVPLVDQPAA